MINYFCSQKFLFSSEISVFLLTACRQQRMLALRLRERRSSASGRSVTSFSGRSYASGRSLNATGYLPACGEAGQFLPRQCSLNGLVCWCVDAEGVILPGSVAPKDQVNCRESIFNFVWDGFRLRLRRERSHTNFNIASQLLTKTLSSPLLWVNIQLRMRRFPS